MVALMMAGLKLVRASRRVDRDDLVDAVAYVMLADDTRGE
jgi:rhamnogalacturonyl hydrolase YesR